MINKLQLEILEKDEKINSTSNELKKIMHEVAYLQDQNHQMKSEHIQKDEEIGLLTEEVKNYEDLISNLKRDLEMEISSKNQLLKNSSKTSKELDEYRTATHRALEQLLQEMGKDISKNGAFTDMSLLSFPDENLATLQVEAIKRRNTIL